MMMMMTLSGRELERLVRPRMMKPRMVKPRMVKHKLENQRPQMTKGKPLLGTSVNVMRWSQITSTRWI